jgi:hypothetical protein
MTDQGGGLDSGVIERGYQIIDMSDQAEGAWDRGAPGSAPVVNGHQADGSVAAFHH